MIDQLLAQLAQFAANLLQGIGTWMSGLVNTIVEWVTGVVAYISNAIIAVIHSVEAFFTAFAAQLKAFFEGMLKGLVDVFQQLWQKVIGGLITILDNLRAFVQNLIDGFKAVIGGIVSGITSAFAIVKDKVVELLTVGVNAIKDFVTSVGTKIAEFLQPILDAVVAFVRGIALNVQAGIDAIIGSAHSLLTTVNDRLQDVKQGFVDAAADVVSSLTGLSDDVLMPIKKAVTDYLETLGESYSDESLAHAMQSFEKWAGGHTMALQSREDAMTYWQSIMPRDKVGRYLFGLLTQVGSVMAVYSGVAQANAAVVLQEFAATYSYQLLPAADLATAARRQRITPEVAKQSLRRQGYSEADADIILDITQTVPAAGDMLASWQRGELQDGELNRGFAQLGIVEPYATMLKKLSFVLPPVQDLITMAVREAFSPEIAERFGQFQDFPEAFASEAKKQGLSEEWAKKYWAAHWSLPSIEQGFEMVHRKAMPPEDLDVLLRALDVMPHWREPLKLIAYQPFTRVDIRRMHAMKILDRDAVVRAHLDLGYDAIKAEQLTEFTLKLNAHTATDDDAELGKLTRSAILGFYADGLISRERAVALLVGAGISSDAAGLYVQATDLDVERARRKDATQLILDRYAAGVLDFQQAQGQLTALNLSTREIDAATVKLVEIRDKGTRLPTRAEAEAFLTAKIITPETFRDLLSRLGYAPVWAEAFMALHQRKANAS
jgi:hypothetical protein